MVDVKRVKLPGVGVLHTFVTDGGGKVGVITHRSGSSDLVAFSDAEDSSKAVKVALRLDEEPIVDSSGPHPDIGSTLHQPELGNALHDAD